MFEQPSQQQLTQWAQMLGEHALILYLGLLALLLAATALGGWVAGRFVVRRAGRTALPPTLLLTAQLAAGFMLVVLAGLGFVELAEALDASDELGQLDDAFSGALGRSVSWRTLQVFAWITRLGDTSTLTGLCIIVAALLVLRKRRWLALAWVLAVSGNAVLNSSLKQIFERVRPVHEHGLIVAEGYSFPSGHASGSLVSYGLLAYLAWRLLPARWHLPALLLAAATAFTTGCSRVFLQVHYPSDVAAGFASGAAWLSVCIASIELTRRRAAKYPSVQGPGDAPDRSP